MLLTLLVMCGLFCGYAHVVFAAPDAVLNDPPAAVSVVKSVVDKLDSSYETVWDLAEGDFRQGVSAALYGFTSNDIHLASARLGYATGETFYGSLALDLPGLSRRFIPQTVKGLATTAPLDVVWGLVGKYARAGVFGGYTWDRKNRTAYGLTFGAALSF